LPSTACAQVNAGADKECRDRHGRTAFLHACAHSGTEDCAHMLAMGGCNVEARGIVYASYVC
jgi:ankyrin repeat protein